VTNKKEKEIKNKKKQTNKNKIPNLFKMTFDVFAKVIRKEEGMCPEVDFQPRRFHS
jgi:hypothetical protein